MKNRCRLLRMRYFVNIKRIIIAQSLTFILFFSSVLFSEAKTSNQLFRIKAGKMRMKISENGGRIVSLTYLGQELLTQEPEHVNFGSTLWTAPQLNWGWPPFPVLDSQKYDVFKNGNILRMISKPDSSSGFQIEKVWRQARRNSISICYSIRNISNRPQSVGTWEVTRARCGGLAFFPEGESGNIPESDLKPDLIKNGISWFNIDKNPSAQNKKKFSTAKEGWLAYAINNLLFIKQYPDIQMENYAPQQGEVEIYVDKNKSYVELENHGAYRVLLPGESLVYPVIWYVLPFPTKIEAGNEQLYELVRKIINIPNP